MFVLFCFLCQHVSCLPHDSHCVDLFGLVKGANNCLPRKAFVKKSAKLSTPLESHVNWCRSFLVDCIVRYSDCTGIVKEMIRKTSASYASMSNPAYSASTADATTASIS